MKNLPEERLRIAIQKSGRLSDDSIQLLRRCGIKLQVNTAKLCVHSENFPLDLLLVRDDDIPGLVMDGVCDLGIVGTNVLREKTLMREQQYDNGMIEEIQTLDFGQCRLAIAVPDSEAYEDESWLNGKRIATTYPFLLKRFFEMKQVAAKIVNLSGSVEVAPRLGVADAICDLVSTGATLEANGLKAVETVFKSQAILIKTSSALSQGKQNTAELLQRRLYGVLQANESKYIMLHAPHVAVSDVVALLPGVRHPTIMPLDSDPETVAIHAVCRESVFWETMEKLKAVGASSILVLPIEKMMA